MAANVVEIRVQTNGVEAASKAIQSLGTAGSQSTVVIVKGTKEADTALAGFKGRLSEVSSVAQQAGINTGILSSAIGALTSPLGLAAVAAGVLTAGIRSVTQAMVENFKEVKNLQAVSGLSAEAADNLADTFQLLGKDSATLTNALFKMSSEIDNGGGALTRLGISVRDSAGNLKNEGALFLEARDRISQIGSASQRSAMLMALFGRAGRELADVFSMSAEKFKAYSDEASTISGWNETMQKDTESLVIAQNKLAMSWNALKTDAGGTIVPLLTRIVDLTTLAMKATRELVYWTDLLIGGPDIAGLMKGHVDALVAAEAARKAAESIGPGLPNEAEQKASLLGIERRKQAALGRIAAEQAAAISAIALEEVTHRDSVARMTMTEEQFIATKMGMALDLQRVELAAIDAREKAELAAIGATAAKIRAGVIDASALKPGTPQGNELFALDTRRAGVVAESEKARAGIVAKTETEIQALKTQTYKLQQEQAAWEIQHEARIAAAALASGDARLAMQAKLSADLIGLQGSEPEIFKAQLQAETAALIEQAQERIKNNSDMAAVIEQIWQVHNAKLAKFDQDRTQAAIAQFAQWQQATEDMADDGAGAIERAHNAQLGVINTALALGLVSFDTAEKAKLTLQGNRILQQSAREEGLIQRNAELYALDVTNFNSAENLRLRQKAANLQRELGMREQLIRDEIALLVQAEAGIDQEASRRLAVEAGVVTGILAERQKLINNLDIIGDKERLFWEQGIAHAAAYAKSIGDTAGFFDATFTAALTKGTDLWSSLTSLAQGSAQDIRSAFGGFWDDFQANLAKGEGMWKSFTSALSSLWNNLMNSLIKRFADFLINMAINAATSQQGGGWLAALVGAAGAAGGGNVGTGGVTVDAGGAPILNTGGTQTAATNLYGLASTGVSLIGFAQKLVGAWDIIVGAFQAGVESFTLAVNLGQGALQGFANAAVDAVNFGVEAAQASQALQGLRAAGPYVTAAVAAVVVALTAMRNDITDTGKAVQSALTTAAAAFAIAGMVTGQWYLAVVAVAIIAVGAILEWTGVFEKASEEWLAFPGKLAATLNQEQTALQAFGEELKGATDLSGVATSIKNFKSSIDAFIPDFSARPEVKGLGLFQVPGIPGATGTEHEGGIAFDFNPFIAQIQAAIDTVLNGIRDTISVKLTDAARMAMPATLFDAFRTGTLVPLRDSFEKLVTSSTATIEDIVKFEDRMKEVGQILIAFATVSAGLTSLEAAAKKALPDDLFAGALKMSAAFNQRLVDLAASGTATIEDLKAVASELETLGKIIEAFARTALQLRNLASTSQIVLPADLAGPVAGLVSGLRTELVDLANTGTATAAEIQALEARIQALATGIALYQTLSQEIAAMSGDFATLTQAAKDAVRVSRAFAEQAITDARDMLTKAIDGPEMATAATNLHNAIIAKYELELKLVRDIQAEINRLLDMANDLKTNALISTSASVALGNIGPLAGLVDSLNTLATTADNAAVRLWAANAALQAITSSLPGIVTKFGPGVGPGDLGGALQQILGQAMPAINAMADLFNQAKNAGDLESALTILNQGAAAINALAQAGLAAVEQWRSQSLEVVHAFAEAQIGALNSAAQTAITAAQEHGRALTEANDLQAEANNEQIRSLQKQRDGIKQVANLWGGLFESVSRLIVSLTLGTSSPLNPADALAFAQSNLAAAEAAFASGATPENAMAVQQAVQDVLSAGQNVWTRPSPEWNALFTSMIGKLEGIKAAAASFMTPDESAAASLISIDSQIEALNEANRALAADNKLIAKNTATAVEAIERHRDAEIAVVRASEAAQVLAINQSADRARDGINAGLAAIMGQIAKEQQALLQTLLGQQMDLLHEITGPGGAQAHLALKATETVDELILIKKALNEILAGIPQGAYGIERTQGGLYRLHPDETVLNPEDAEWWRGMRSGVTPATTFRPVQMVPSGREEGGTLVMEEGAFTVNISGVSDQEVIASLRRELKDFERRLLNGDIRYRLGLDKRKH